MKTTEGDPNPIDRTTIEDSTRTAGTPSEAVPAPRSDTVVAQRTGVWRQTFLSLGNRDFRNLWLGMLLVMGANQMQLLASGYLVFDITGSPILLAVVNGGYAVPMLCLGLFGGAISDRLERKRIIQISQISSGLAALFVGVSITTGTVTWVHLFGVSIYQGGMLTFLMPARQSIIPQLVGKDRLTNALAINAMGMSITTLAAPAAAGILYAVMGPDVLYYVICAIAISSILPTALLPKLTAVDGKDEATIWRDIGAGLSYIRQSPLVLVLLLLALAMAALSMPFRLLLPIFVVDIYHRGPEAMGLLVSIYGAGSLVGALLIAALGNIWKRGPLLIAGSILTGVVLLLVAVLPHFFAALGFMVLLGLGHAAHRTLSDAVTMEVTEAQYRGRVMGIVFMNFAFVPLAVLPAGVAVEFVGGQVTIGAMAVLLLAAILWILATQKSLRELR